MSISFSPNGFGGEQKQRAAECEAQWDAATNSVIVIGVAAAHLFPPAVPALVLLAALGPLMRYPFTRAKLDPLRHDFYRVADVRQPLVDASLAVHRGDGFDSKILLQLVCFDRVAAHLDAMITAAERALGAYRRASEAGMEARLAEAQLHAQHAFSGLYVVTSTYAVESLDDPVNDVLPSVFESAGQTISQAVGDLDLGGGTTVADILLSCGPLGEDALALAVPADDHALAQHLQGGSVSGASLVKDFQGAAFASAEWLETLLEAFPRSVADFISSQTGAVSGPIRSSESE